MKRTAVAAAVLLLATCTTSAPRPVSPSWDAVPPFVLDALCKRMQMDAIGSTSTLTVIRTTQPIATPGAIGHLGGLSAKRVDAGQMNLALAEANRVMPLSVTDGDCTWSLIDASAKRRYDDMIVEITAPFANPAVPGEAGLFARVSLDTQQEWYWISLAPRGGAWAVRYVNAVSR